MGKLKSPRASLNKPKSPRVSQQRLINKPKSPRKSKSGSASPPRASQQQLVKKSKLESTSNTRARQRPIEQQVPLHAKSDKNCKAALQVEQEIRAIYKTHAPEKVADISKLLLKFRGNEHVLLSKIKEKYELL